jgi:hypothetical protein
MCRWAEEPATAAAYWEVTTRPDAATGSEDT